MEIKKISGNNGGFISDLSKKYYHLNAEIKGVEIGGCYFITLPKGTLITNVSGGVFAYHKELILKYSKAFRYDNLIGFRIKKSVDILELIEKYGEVTEAII